MKKFNNLDEWLEFQRFSANLYAYTYNEQLQIYAINKAATAVAPFDVWSKIGLRIKYGSKAMTVYDKNGLKKHLFDISQTDGKQVTPWKYDTAYNPYIYDILDRLYDNPNNLDEHAPFRMRVYDYIFDSAYSRKASPTGQLSAEICELIAETATYAICIRLNVAEESQYKVDFSNFAVLDESGQALVGSAAAVYTNVFCRAAKQIVSTVSIEEAQSRQNLLQETTDEKITEFEESVSVVEAAATENNDEVDNSTTQEGYIIDPDDTPEPEPDYNEIVEFSPADTVDNGLDLTDEQKGSIFYHIFQTDYANVNKQAVIKFYNINKSAKVLMRYTYAVYKGSHPIELAEMPDVVKWSATSKGVVFADANGAELYCVNWRTACGYVKQLIRDNEYAISNTIEATSEKGEKETEKYRGSIISTETVRQHMLYARLTEMFPEFMANEYSYVRLESDGYMPLSLDKIGDNTFSMAHYYEQNGDLMADPDVVFRVNAENKTLTAISFQQDNLGIYQTFENGGAEQEDCNSFVGKWLTNISAQGYKPVKATLTNGSEITFDILSVDKSEKNVQVENIKSKSSTLIVNIFGGPGAGKSTTALQLVAELKKLGYHADYVSEVAKELVYAKDFEHLDGTLKNQSKILLEQKRRLDIMLDNVDVVVTDSPLLLNTVYLKENAPEYIESVFSQYENYNNYNVVVERDLSVKFEQEGRIHNLEESIKKDGEINTLLDSHNIDYQRFDRNNIAGILDGIISKINDIKINESSITADNTENEDNVLSVGNIRYNVIPNDDRTTVSVANAETGEIAAEVDCVNRVALKFIYPFSDNEKQQIIEHFNDYDVVYDRDKLIQSAVGTLLLGVDSDSEYIQIKHIEMVDNDPDNYRIVEDVENKTEHISVDTDTDIPFAIGDEIDYKGLHYTVAGIDTDKNTVTLLDNNTGWYPLFHNEVLSKVAADFNAEKEKEIVQSTVVATADNFVITDEQLGVGGPKEKFRKNVTAIRLLKKIEEEKRQATKEEQQILSEYVGWGGLFEAFDSKNSSWSTEYEQLKSLLSEEEYRNAFGSVLNAHYTQPVVIKSMYSALEKLGFSGGKILEPAAGVGNFIGCVPQNLSDNSMFTAVEIDSISGRIAQNLYPQAEVQVCGYEKAKLSAGSFDVAVGNVPFGEYTIVDKKYNRSNALIHDYFFLKTLEMVRPNGVVAFITSKGTMDKRSSKVRKAISEKADFIGAIRLPNTAFKANAGTTVVSDIIFLQKKAVPQTSESEWLNTAINDQGQTINEYFINHPEMICGNLTVKSGPHGPELTVMPYDNITLAEALGKCVDHLVDNTNYKYTQLSARPVAAERDDSNENELLPAPENIRNGFYTVINGKPYRRNGNVLVPAKRKSGKPLSPKEIEILAAAVDLAQDLRYAIDVQNTDISDEDFEKVRSDLESKYDKFVEKYGHINDKNNRTVYGVINNLRDDNIDFLRSIETEKFKKSAILQKRTIRPVVKIEHCDSVEDGFQAVLALKGYIDIAQISKITGSSIDECIERLNGVLMFRDPDELFSADLKKTDGWLTVDEYLSGNVVEKLRKATLLSTRFPELKVNAAALEKVQPEKIKAVDILAQVGSSWIPEKYIEQFIDEVFHCTSSVDHNTETAKWTLSNKNNGNWRSTTNTEYGTSDINALFILENALNLKDSTVWRDKRDEFGRIVYDDKGNKVREKDVEKTIAVNHKAEKIKEKFKEWIWTDAYRTQDLENIYNAKYNTERARTYDGSHITFVGMNKDIHLADHQKNAVARVLYGGNTLLAHVVGAGKTFEMTAAAMEMKRIGAANKPLFVVPNHLIRQWYKEFLTLYPDANVLTATSADFEKSRRKAFVSRIATGDYDAVIMGYSTFAKISISPAKRKEYYEQQIDELREIIQTSTDEDSLSVKDAAKKLKLLETKLEKLEYVSQDDNIYFENLGVDALFIDEAHNFKNLSINTKLTRIAGIKSGESKRSEDLLLKIQYIKEKQNGLDRGIVFATGTPISNSLTEMYVMKKYLEPDYLREKGLQHFDSWVADFAEITTNIELSPTGNSWRAKKRCSTFKNLPELMNIFRRVADIQTAESLKLPVPALKNGKYTICLSKPSEGQKQYILDCGERAEQVHQRLVDPSEDNMLKITNDGKMCALDMRLVDPTAEDNPESKINMAVNNIFHKWEETKADSLTQVVFLDRSTPSSGFNLYDDIKGKLTALGIPEEEIKYIHDAKTDNDKIKLFDDVNDGKVRIIIGSTEKMGAGTNIQKKLCALHHIDVPWRPSDIEQREGRILRQGNDCKEVEIFRYATEGTFDSYSWQTIEYKQKFISQVMTNKPLGRSINDVDEVALNYAEIKSLATGDPRIKKQLELSTQVDNLRREKAEFDADKMKARENITFTIPAQIQRADGFIKKFGEDVEYSKQFPSSDEFSVSIVGNTITDREEAGKAVKALRKVGGDEPIDVCEYRGFKIQIQYSALSGIGSFKTIVSHNATMFTSLGLSNVDVFDNIDKTIDVDLPALLQKHKDELETAQKNLENFKVLADKEFPKLQEYLKKKEELNKLTTDLGLNDNSDSTDIVFKNDDISVAFDKSYIRDKSGAIVAKYTYCVPENFVAKIYEDTEEINMVYGSVEEYVRSIQSDNSSIYDRAQRLRKVSNDDTLTMDDNVKLCLQQCNTITIDTSNDSLTLQGIKPDGTRITVGTFDYDYSMYQTVNEVAKMYSDKLNIPLGDDNSRTISNSRGL